jgi:hypothetical protein
MKLAARLANALPTQPAALRGGIATAAVITRIAHA